tara:strand:- start:4276 stop:4821 length:546 start_codon:yes stop_codon:yes gene_type:complete
MKQKKYKTITIGNSKDSIHVNDIGSPKLHEKHKVCIRPIEKNSKIGRAIVLDQHIIDVMYTENYLDERQHNVCEKYLDIISRSGAYASAPSPEKIFTSKSFNTPTPRSCLLIRVQKVIKDFCGNEKEKVFWRLMSDNPKKINEHQIEITVECSNALLHHWYVNQESPVSLFQQALISQTSS